MKRLLVTSIILGTLLTIYGQQKMRFSVHADPQFAWFSSDEKNIYMNIWEDEAKIENIFNKNGEIIPDYKTVMVDEIPISVVGKNYKLIQNSDFFGYIEKTVERLGGELISKNERNGYFRKTYTINREFDISGDILKVGIFAMNSYNGKFRAEIRTGFYRLVCKNGLVVWDKGIGIIQKHTLIDSSYFFGKSFNSDCTKYFNNTVNQFTLPLIWLADFAWLAANLHKVYRVWQKA